MKHEFKKISDSRIALEVEIPVERVQEEFRKLMQELKKNVKLNGFRPGRIPDSVLKMRFGKDIREQLGSQLIDESFPKILSESDFELSSKPEFDEWKLNESEPFKYSVQFDIIPEIEVKDYKGIRIEKPELTVSEEYLQKSLENIARGLAVSESVTDRNAQTGDAIEGKLSLVMDDKPVPGWKNRSIKLILGQGTLFPGSPLEEQIVGAALNKPHTFTVDFPEDYEYYKDFAGKTVSATVVLSSIESIRIPEINDDLAIDQGLKDLDELKDEIRKSAIEKMKADFENSLDQQILERLIEANPVEVTEFQTMMQMDASFSDRQDIGLDLNNQNVVEFLKPMAEQQVKKRIILDAIAEKEKDNIQVSDDEVEAEFQKELEYSGKDEVELRKQWYDEGMFDIARKTIRRNKAWKLVRDSIELVEKAADPAPTAAQDSSEPQSAEEPQDAPEPTTESE